MSNWISSKVLFLYLFPSECFLCIPIVLLEIGQVSAILAFGVAV